MITITLPWPNRRLSPNARLFWATKARAVRDARETARLLTMQANGDGPVPVWLNPLPVRWQFYPPTKRRYDRDNLIASCKAYQDGIADAVSLDDFRFMSSYEFGEVTAGGKIVVEIGVI